MPATPHPDLRGRIDWRTSPDARRAPPVVIRPTGALERMLGSRALRRAAAATLIGAAAASMWLTRENPAAAVRVAPRWDIEVSSAGARPVRAVVFGSEAGVHLVRVPAAGAPAEARRSIGARLALGDVYIVSIGRSPLVVSTESPSSMRVTRLSATSRVVKLHQRGEATTIRTGW